MLFGVSALSSVGLEQQSSKLQVTGSSPVEQAKQRNKDRYDRMAQKIL